MSSAKLKQGQVCVLELENHIEPVYDYPTTLLRVFLNESPSNQYFIHTPDIYWSLRLRAEEPDMPFLPSCRGHDDILELLELDPPVITEFENGNYREYLPGMISFLSYEQDVLDGVSEHFIFAMDYTEGYFAAWNRWLDRDCEETLFIDDPVETEFSSILKALGGARFCDVVSPSSDMFEVENATAPAIR